jgi:hypothetical protein
MPHLPSSILRASRSPRQKVCRVASVVLPGTVSAHLTRILTLYFNRRFFAQRGERRAKPNVNTFKEVL